VALSIPFWLESRWNAAEARQLSDQARLLAARIREQDGKADALGLDDDSSMQGEPDDEEPEMIFHLVRKPGETEEVHIFLDQRMLGDLRHGEPWAWQGLIEFVEDDVDPLP